MTKCLRIYMYFSVPETLRRSQAVTLHILLLNGITCDFVMMMMMMMMMMVAVTLEHMLLSTRAVYWTSLPATAEEHCVFDVEFPRGLLYRHIISGVFSAVYCAVKHFISSSTKFQEG
jgi:hypothetical protein